MSQDSVASFNSLEEDRSMYMTPPLSPTPSQLRRNNRGTLQNIIEILFGEENVDDTIPPPPANLISPDQIEETEENILRYINSQSPVVKKPSKKCSNNSQQVYINEVEQGVPNDEQGTSPPPDTPPQDPPPSPQHSGQEQPSQVQPPPTSVNPPQHSLVSQTFGFQTSYPYLTQILNQPEEQPRLPNVQSERPIVIVAVRGNADSEWSQKSQEGEEKNEKNEGKASEGTLKIPIRKSAQLGPTQPTPKKSRKIPIQTTSPVTEQTGQTAPPISPDLPIAASATPLGPSPIEANELDVFSQSLEELEQRLVIARVDVLNEIPGSYAVYQKISKEFHAAIQTYQFLCTLYGERVDFPLPAISQPFEIFNFLPPMWRCIEEDLNFHLNKSARQFETRNVDGFTDPDFEYFHNLIALLFKERGIDLTSEEIDHSAEVFYEEVIMELRRRRFQDYTLLGELLELAGDSRDPADSDPELLRKLQENDKLKKPLPKTLINLFPRTKKSFKKRVQPTKVEDDPYNPDNIERDVDQTPSASTTFEKRMLRKRSCSSSTEEKNGQIAKKKKAVKKTVFFRGSECIALSDSEEDEEEK